MSLSKKCRHEPKSIFQKAKNLTGKTQTISFVTSVLNQAAKLLLKSDLNITEIAYQTGFTSPEVFQGNVSKQFGESPSQYIENQKVSREITWETFPDIDFKPVTIQRTAALSAYPCTTG